MNDDGLSAETGSPVSEDVRQRGIDFLQELLASGKVDLARFQKALDALLEARTHADFASVVRSLPSPVELTPPARRREEPLKIFYSRADVRLEGRWQVSQLSRIYTGFGNVRIDLCQAEFDDWDVKIDVGTGFGKITVIVPRGFEVRPVGRSGQVNSALEPPIPGFPVVRLSATANQGAIRVRHPAEKKRRQRWRLRRRLPVLACQGLEARRGSRREGRRDIGRHRLFLAAGGYRKARVMAAARLETWSRR